MQTAEPTKLAMPEGNGCEYSPEELAFSRAVDAWLAANGRKFPSRIDYLRIAKSLGYALAAPASETCADDMPAPARLCMRCHASPVASAKSELCVGCIEARFEAPRRPLASRIAVGSADRAAVESADLVRGTCPTCGIALVRLSTAPETCESCIELARRKGVAQ